MNETERRVLDAIDMDGLLALLGDLVAIPSLDGTPEEFAVQQHVAEWMRANGLEVDVWELDFPALQRHPQASWEVERARGLGVVASLGAGMGGRSLIFNGHTDVVPAGDMANWLHPPFAATVADGRVYGRGSVDMKGGLCCALFAARAIQAAGVQLRGRLMIESVIGEEDGGIGTLAAVLRGYHADGAVIMEPTELRIAPAQAGASIGQRLVALRVSDAQRRMPACPRPGHRSLPLHAAWPWPVRVIRATDRMHAWPATRRKFRNLPSRPPTGRAFSMAPAARCMAGTSTATACAWRSPPPFRCTVPTGSGSGRRSGAAAIGRQHLRPGLTAARCAAVLQLLR